MSLMLGAVLGVLILQPSTPDFDEDGRVSQMDLARFCAMWIEHREAGGQFQTSIDLTWDGVVDHADAAAMIQAHLGGNLMGRVIYQTGWPPEDHPFPNALIVLKESNSRKVFRRRSNKAGFFAFWGIPPGIYQLTVEKTVWQASQWQMRPRDDLSQIQMSLQYFKVLRPILMEPMPPEPGKP